VLVLGGGLVHDVPVAELCAVFEEVVLVDLVHPLSSRIQTWRWRNLRRLEWDVTGVMDRLPDPVDGCEPDLSCGMREVDLVVSVNLLSQICWAPARILEGVWEAAQVERFLAGMVRAHLDALNRVPCAAALITDYAWSRYDVRTQKTTQWGVLQGVELPGNGLRWDWAIAPAPERERSADFTAQVAGYVDWKQSGWA
jgi:hypothetical protein